MLRATRTARPMPLKGRTKGKGRHTPRNEPKGKGTGALWDEGSSAEEDAPAERSARLTVNAEFAARHAHNKARDEAFRLEAKYGKGAADAADSDASSTETSDSEAEALTEHTEREFMLALAKLKGDKPEIYDGSKPLFTEEPEGGRGPKRREPKRVTLKDHERMRLQTKGALAFVSDEEEEGDGVPQQRPGHDNLAFNAEQRQLRKGLVAALHAAADGDGDEGEDLFSSKEKSAAEVEADEADYAAWLGDEGALGDEEAAQELEPLRRFWTDPKLSEADRFLRDYITQKRWRGDAAPAPRAPQPVVADDEEDAEEVERQDEYERRYNFRFEEGDEAGAVAAYPREVEGSLRRKDSRRKEARQRAAERKVEAKARKTEEIKRLKAIKSKEIAERLEQIREISGTGAALEGLGLGEEFDPEAHDRQMQAAFDDGYYDAAGDDERKPVFPDDLGDIDDEDFNMDADYEPPAQVLSRKRLRELEAEAVDPAKVKDEQVQQQLEEYYNLDYEDVVGGIPCRFKYREVVPNDFGLSTEEVLMAEDGELNRWASLRKTVQYRPEEVERAERRAFKKRRGDIAKKKEVFAESNAWKVTDKGKAREEEEKRRREEKKREKKEKVAAAPPAEPQGLSHRERRDLARKEKQRSWAEEQAKARPVAVSAQRLEAYKSGTKKADIMRDRAAKGAKRKGGRQ